VPKKDKELTPGTEIAQRARRGRKQAQRAKANRYGEEAGIGRKNQGLRWLDNSGAGKHTTAHGRELGEAVAERFSKRFSILTLYPLKNPAWKSDEILLRKAG
jgi:hypothetical protein